MEDRMKLKVKDGKIDLQSLEREIKKKLPVHNDFKFDYDGNKVFVTARKDTTPEGYVELYLFYFYK